jgi:hypothetical protein
LGVRILALARGMLDGQDGDFVVHSVHRVIDEIAVFAVTNFRTPSTFWRRPISGNTVRIPKQDRFASRTASAAAGFRA